MYLGIDTHKRYSQVAVAADDGNLQDEIRLLNDRLDELAEEYAGGEAAIEASGNYCPIYEMLDEHLDVTLVNPPKNRIIADATVKTDRIDAKKFAHMLRADMLAEATSRRTRSAPCGISSGRVSHWSKSGLMRKTTSE